MKGRKFFFSLSGFCLVWILGVSWALAQGKEEPKDLCVSPAKGVLAAPQKEGPVSAPMSPATSGVMVRVGKPAPDFEAHAFVEGGFKNIRLSDYRGKWVALCFYPGDFTFV